MLRYFSGETPPSAPLFFCGTGELEQCLAFAVEEVFGVGEWRCRQSLAESFLGAEPSPTKTGVLRTKVPGVGQLEAEV